MALTTNLKGSSYSRGIFTTLAMVGALSCNNNCNKNSTPDTKSTPQPSETEDSSENTIVIDSLQIDGQKLVNDIQSLTRRALNEEGGTALVKVLEGKVDRYNWVGVSAPDLCNKGFGHLKTANGFALIDLEEENRSFMFAHIANCNGNFSLEMPAGMQQIFAADDKCTEKHTCGEVYDELASAVTSPAQ